MTRDEQIRGLFSLPGRMSIRSVATAAIDAGIFPSYSPRSGVESACRRAVSAIDETTGLPFGYRLPRSSGGDNEP